MCQIAVRWDTTIIVLISVIGLTHVPRVRADNVAQESQHYSQYSEHPRSGCHTEYDHVSVVKQVPTFSKHCTTVDETKCKTIFKNSYSTAMETQCTPTFDTSCDSTLNTAYKQECKTIKDVECRIVNLEDHSGGHYSKKICEDVPTEKCVPVPVKVEGQKCVNVPTQTCETVPVTATNPVPKKQCYKKPKKVCQTLVSTKPKIVTAKIPREVCDHSASVHQGVHKTKTVPKLSSVVMRPSPKLTSRPEQTAAESGTTYQVQPPLLTKLEDLYTAAEYPVYQDQDQVPVSQLSPQLRTRDFDNSHLIEDIEEDLYS